MSSASVPEDGGQDDGCRRGSQRPGRVHRRVRRRARARRAAPAAGTTTTSTTAAGATGDLAIVNYALTLEYLEAQFYAKVVTSGLFHGATLATLKQLRRRGARARRGAKSEGREARARPRRSRPASSRCTAQSTVAKLAATVENLGAAAYLGQAGEHQEQGDPRRGARDPHRRGAPRRDAEHAAEDVADARRRASAGRCRWPGARGGQAVHRV